MLPQIVEKRDVDALRDCRSGHVRLLKADYCREMMYNLQNGHTHAKKKEGSEMDGVPRDKTCRTNALVVSRVA